jgi:hypothetical protein
MRERVTTTTISTIQINDLGSFGTYVAPCLSAKCHDYSGFRVIFTTLHVCGVEGKSKSLDAWINDYWAFSRGTKPDVLEDDRWVEEQRKRVDHEDSAAALQWILGRDPKVVLQSAVFAMNRGDYEALARIQTESFNDPVTAQRFNKVMLTERNLHWMSRLSRFMDEGNAVVVVGAMHLPGPDGLVSLLRSQGYKVTQSSVIAFLETPLEKR